MDDVNWQVIGVLVVVGIICGIAGYYIAPSETIGLTDEEVNTKVSDAVKQALTQKNAEIKTLKRLIKESENNIAFRIEGGTFILPQSDILRIEER